MQKSKSIGFIREKVLAFGKWIVNAFRFRKGNLLDSVLRGLVIIICLLFVSSWLVNRFTMQNKFEPQVPSTEDGLDLANLTNLVRNELQLLLATEYAWLLQPVEATQLPEEILPNPEDYLPNGEQNEEGLDTIQVLATSFESLLWPINGDIAYDYGWYRHPVYQDWRFNNGLTFISDTAEQIRSVLPGRITSILPGETGFDLVIEHGSGWQSVYEGVRAVSVHVGDMVQQNQSIAEAGQNGELFFGLYYQEESINPMEYMASY